ncbi:MAG: lipoate--protein ligase family protein [Propionibacteriaceae bacterium]|jgi:lipoate-protein ligase A|nr:lipoate--protein ligase family protein [Propionibacteriaceae bacterium]
MRFGVLGQYKEPGGKLVAADLDVTDGVLSRVSISGDFFLEPDWVLETINQALLGLPVNVDAAGIVSRLEGLLPPETVMSGVSVSAIAVAVRRALGNSLAWEDLTFDLIPPRTLPPVLHVALDEVLAGRVGAGLRAPQLRFWDWDTPCVVIGSFQSVRGEVDEEAAARLGIAVVRRGTGGGAMFMEPGNCITFSLVVPGELVEGLSYAQSYRYLDDWVLAALAELGVAATYQPLNDIASPAGKIAGAAQRRLADGTVLHHVTMAYDIDQGKMAQVLRIGREKLSDKGTPSAAKRVDPLRSQTGLSRAAVIAHFMKSFAGRYACHDSDYTDSELAEARELVRNKFDTARWRYRVP